MNRDLLEVVPLRPALVYGIIRYTKKFCQTIEKAVIRQFAWTVGCLSGNVRHAIITEIAVRSYVFGGNLVGLGNCIKYFVSVLRNMDILVSLKSLSFLEMLSNCETDKYRIGQ